jgi:lysophospholipase L1-like esterase/acetyl esterase/lipase
MKIQLLFLLLVIFTSRGYAQEVIQLYEGKAPGSEKWDWSEQTSTNNNFNTEVVYNVGEPTITAYLPPYHLATGTAVVVAPGGAFHILSINNEGVDVAKWLNSKGIAAFVLKYRLARSYTDDPVQELVAKMTDFDKLDKVNAPIVPLAMADGLAAIKYVRDHAEELEVDPGKIGIMGFSAGATLAMSVAYNGTEENKPNFVAPIYAYEPAIIGNTLPKEKTPIFVAVAGDDQLGMVPYSLNIYRKWFEAGHPAELHVFEKGGHGFGMRTQNLPTDKWMDRFWDWLKLHGYNKKLYPSKYEKLYGEEAIELGRRQEGERLRNDFGGMARYKAANIKVMPPKPGEKRVVFLGNSITDAWPRIDSSFFKDNHYIGRGISAQTSSQLLVRFQQDVVNLQPVAVLIHIGTNDVAENTGPYDPELTMGNIRSMAEIARANNIKVILASVLPHTKFEWRRELGNRSDMIVDLNRRIKGYADQNGIPYLDYHSAMKNAENGMDPELAEDGVHPTPEGYQIMAKMAKEVIDRMLN